MAFDVNPNLPAFRKCKLPGVGLLVVCVLFSLSLVGLKGQPGTNLLNSRFSNRNIYVDYGQTPASYRVVAAATNGLGSWIWAKQTLDKQTIHLWKSFNIPASDPAVHADLRIAADNAFKVWLDGQEIGDGSDWRTLSIYELNGKLDPGTHVLAIEGFNDCDKAGVIVGFHLKLADGRVLEIPSDTSWNIVPNSVSGWQTATRPSEDWPKATFIAHLGQFPWWSIPTTVAHIQESFPRPVPFWQGRDFQFVLVAACGFFIMIGFYLLIQFVSQSRTHRLLQIERDRIARDIHDDLGSKLTQLLLTGEASQIKQETSDVSVPRMCEGARDILATIDEVIWIVNSQHNKLNDFAIQVCKHAQRFLESSHIRFRFDVDHELPPRTLTQLCRRNLFMAVKEALNNAVKHSQATELTIHIQLDGPTFVIMVEDNGIGFDCQHVNITRNGLVNMMQRMEEIGGSSRVISQSGEGCKICLSVPLKNSRLRRHWLGSLNQNRSHAHEEDGDVPAEEITQADKSRNVL